MAEAHHQIGHPAPQRFRIRGAALLFGLLGAPLAWAAHLLIGYGFASHPCYPGHVPLAAAPEHWSLEQFPVLLASDALALIVAIIAGLVAWRAWARTRTEGPGLFEDMMQRGEGRTRFLAFWGVMLSAGFGAATLFDTAALFLVPLCTY